MEKRHRVFIAINLPEDVKKTLAKYQEKWPELPAKWTAKDNLHITLEFLGDLTDVEIADVCKVVGEVAEKHGSFSINLNKILYGPYSRADRLATGSTAPPAKYRAPRMVWAEGEKSDELADLKQDLQEYLLEKISYRPEGRGFTPHITLARINEWQWKAIEPEERPEINEEIDFVAPVESIEVMESELKRGGPVYTVIESHQLNDNS